MVIDEGDLVPLFANAEAEDRNPVTVAVLVQRATVLGARAVTEFSSPSALLVLARGREAFPRDVR